MRTLMLATASIAPVLPCLLVHPIQRKQPFPQFRRPCKPRKQGILSSLLHV